MTRKDALREAIHIVSKARIGKQRKAEIVAGLELCRRELPFSHWSREAIFDACDTWVQEHGALSVTAFASPQMPSHPVIQNRFGMTARAFRDQFYPARDAPSGSRRGLSRWNELFAEEFNRIRCTGQRDYNRRRDRGLPTWNTMAKMNRCGTWSLLLEKLSLKTYRTSHPAPEVRISYPEPLQSGCPAPEEERKPGNIGDQVV